MRRASALSDTLIDMPQMDAASFQAVDQDQLLRPERATHAPRILLLYGSVRQRSFSRLATQEAARILEAFGAETRIYNPSGLPLPDDAEPTHPKVQELRDLVTWSEGMVWCSPERGELRHDHPDKFLQPSSVNS
jgi:arsenical resistance protein ArsH